MPKYDKLEPFKPTPAESQEILDLSLHAMKQVLEVLDRTAALLQHPAAKVMLAENISMAALTGQAKRMRQLLGAEAPGNFQAYMNASLMRLADQVQSFGEFKKTRGIED